MIFYRLSTLGFTLCYCLGFPQPPPAPPAPVQQQTGSGKANDYQEMVYDYGQMRPDSTRQSQFPPVRLRLFLV